MQIPGKGGAECRLESRQPDIEGRPVYAGLAAADDLEAGHGFS